MMTYVISLIGAALAVKIIVPARDIAPDVISIIKYVVVANLFLITTKMERTAYNESIISKGQNDIFDCV